MNKLAARLFLYIDRVSHIFYVVAGVFLVIAALLILVEIILRSVFNISTLIADEVSVYLMIAMVYFGMAHIFKKGEHINIDLLTRRLKPRGQLYVRRFIAMLILLVSIFLSWRAWEFAVTAYKFDVVSFTWLYTPQYIPRMFVGLGLVIFMLQAAVELGRLFSRSNIE